MSSQRKKSSEHSALSENQQKTKKILSSAAKKNIEELKLLLDAPQWYTVEDKNGRNLLQNAVLRKNKEVFDFLLSIKDFPLDATNPGQPTALLMCLLVDFGTPCFKIDEIAEYFAVELIKHGANIDAVDKVGRTLLHLAVQLSYVEVGRLLLEKGVDVNAEDDEGETPFCVLFDKIFELDLGCMTRDSFFEYLYMLLYYGADVFPPKNPLRGVGFFNEFVIYGEGEDKDWEILFYYVIDEYSEYEIYLSALLKIISESESQFFHQVIDKAVGVLIDTHVKDLFLGSVYIFMYNSSILKALIDKFDYIVTYILKRLNVNSSYLFNSETLANFTVLLESHLINQTINFINRNLSIYKIIDGFYNPDPSVIIELIYYLLPYFKFVSALELELVYKKFGDYDLLKILLHMDIDLEECHKSEGFKKDIVPAIYYDLNLNFENYFKTYSLQCSLYDGDVERYCIDDHLSGFSVYGINRLMDYFSSQKLKDFCYKKRIDKLIRKAEKLPQVPLLVELARNTCRTFLIAKYNITTPRQFYTILNWLPIGRHNKQILAYEVPLYTKFFE